MSDWTTEAQAAIDLCSSWASNVSQCACVDLFLFGSVIYKGGVQFDALNSDLDIIAVFGPASSAIERVKCLSELLKEKLKLELSIIPTLGRSVCDEPSVSIVPVTQFEIKANVHKSGARRFFDRNTFLDLRTGDIAVGLSGSATSMVPDEYRNALEYVQSVRSKYLSKAANSTGGLKIYTGSDPMPKALLRFAAQLNGEAADGEWYDTRHGLELMFDKLRERRLEHEDLRSLFDLVSVRRGGRGSKQPLTDLDQVLLSELLFDVASDITPEDVVVWEIRFSKSAGLTPADHARIKNLINRLIPDATVIDTRLGSLILRIRSSEAGLSLIKKLDESGALASLFEVDSINLSVLDLESSGFGSFPEDKEQQLLEHISAWRPHKGVSGRSLEDSLQDWLVKDALPALRDDNGFVVMRDTPIEHSGRQLSPDFIVWWKDEGKIDLVAIELKQLRSRRSFVQVAERLLDLPFRVYLVLVGDGDFLESVREDIERLGRTSGKLKVVPIFLS